MIAQINHSDYSMLDQDGLDVLAQTIGVKRPTTYSFATFKDMVDTVKAFDGKEGICLYYNKGQSIVKIKGDWYLKRHRLKSDLGSTDKVLDLFLSTGHPEGPDVQAHVKCLFDFELIDMCADSLKSICEAKFEVDKMLAEMTELVDSIKTISRKEAALKVLGFYGKGDVRTGMCFTLLDGKTLKISDIKKLYERRIG